MGNKMLIDAAHPEETRVVVCHGNRVEEFDFEAAAKQQLRGNIYLAKVTRVEPSLQAAFIDYGGNRHGFLAFNEIHPDYYQIPVSDREALIAEQQEETSRAAEQDELDDPHIADDDEEYGDTEPNDDDAVEQSAGSDETSDEINSSDDRDDDDVEVDPSTALVSAEEEDRSSSEDTDTEENEEPTSETEATLVTASDDSDSSVETTDVDSTDETSNGLAAQDATESKDSDTNPDGENESISRSSESTGLEVETKSSDELEQTDEPTSDDKKGKRSSTRRSNRPRRRPYKIQEVIKRRQILLVQVVKEERGNKGAALTTFLSLAGRYCVLMPNTARGGGISRKITNARDRKRLKGIANELEIPQGMGLIIRTAGANRTKSEIRRDFDYLMRLWENVRDLTLESSAPALVHEEGSLVRRSIRDLYSKEIESVLVEGENGYKDAKGFMRMLMPSHAKNVKRYKDRTPLFQRYKVEQQLDSMFSPTVELPSGGYIVINPTEALVSIDVNSGRATREHNIEDTAHRTNLEAAEEVARQLRLRDLAGLIVIDFIDMEDNRNNRSVEKKLKDCLRTDRARIQVGRISMFGLMEMSRQRMRSGVLEGSTTMCPHCEGSGLIRSIESAALFVLRAIEQECLKKSPISIGVKVPIGIANYIVNQKREDLLAIEDRYGVSCFVEGDGTLSGTDHVIERDSSRPISPRRAAAHAEILDETAEDEADEAAAAAEETVDASDDGDDAENNGKKRRRRRRRRGSRDGERQEEVSANDAESGDSGKTPEETVDAQSEEDGEDRPKKRRRRGKRGGRRNRSRTQDQEVQETAGDAPANADTADDQAEPNKDDGVVTIPITTPAEFSFYGQADDTDLDEELPTPVSNGHNGAATKNASSPDDSPTVDLNKDNDTSSSTVDEPESEESSPEEETPSSFSSIDDAPETSVTPPVPDNKPRRRGWWQRRD